MLLHLGQLLHLGLQHGLLIHLYFMSRAHHFCVCRVVAKDGKFVRLRNKIICL